MEPGDDDSFANLVPINHDASIIQHSGYLVIEVPRGIGVAVIEAS
jgi:hypothetical protein